MPSLAFWQQPNHFQTTPGALASYAISDEQSDVSTPSYIGLLSTPVYLFVCFLWVMQHDSANTWAATAIPQVSRVHMEELTAISWLCSQRLGRHSKPIKRLTRWADTLTDLDYKLKFYLKKLGRRCDALLQRKNKISRDQPEALSETMAGLTHAWRSLGS